MSYNTFLKVAILIRLLIFLSDKIRVNSVGGMLLVDIIMNANR